MFQEMFYHFLVFLLLQMSPQTVWKKAIYYNLLCAFQMSPQNASPSRGKVILFAFFTFQHCAFSNVSSNCLPVRMHSHTGYICLAFLHCVFSNESSNCLPERMHGHTGCNCLTFLQYGFSNVSVNYLV